MAKLNKPERYELNWVGKRDAKRQVITPCNKKLVPCLEESVDFDTTENLFIEGDNLEALKLLQESYYGKIKMIYIDPPYNTGNDFAYKDDFAESSESRGLNASRECGHSAWLTFMYPRLYLARNLLRDDGVIFISIDDNEAANLKLLCDEVFGAESFVGQFVWVTKNAARGGSTKNHADV